MRLKEAVDMMCVFEIRETPGPHGQTGLFSCKVSWLYT